MRHAVPRKEQHINEYFFALAKYFAHGKLHFNYTALPLNCKILKIKTLFYNDYN